MAYTLKKTHKNSNHAFQALVLRNRASSMNMMAWKEYGTNYDDLPQSQQREIALKVIKDEPMPKSLFKQKIPEEDVA